MATTNNPSSLLNSSTLSKALTKPPPLSSLLSQKSNGTLSSTANSSLSPSPSILQQQPLIGSNLIAQSKKSLELLNQPSNSPSPAPQNSTILSNSLPAGSNTAQLFTKANLTDHNPSTGHLFQSNGSLNTSTGNSSGSNQFRPVQESLDQQINSNLMTNSQGQKAKTNFATFQQGPISNNQFLTPASVQTNLMAPLQGPIDTTNFLSPSNGQMTNNNQLGSQKTDQANFSPLGPPPTGKTNLLSSTVVQNQNNTQFGPPLTSLAPKSTVQLNSFAPIQNSTENTNFMSPTNGQFSNNTQFGPPPTSLGPQMTVNTNSLASFQGQTTLGPPSSDKANLFSSPLVQNQNNTQFGPPPTSMGPQTTSSANSLASFQGQTTLGPPSTDKTNLMSSHLVQNQNNTHFGPPPTSLGPQMAAHTNSFAPVQGQTSLGPPPIVKANFMPSSHVQIPNNTQYGPPGPLNTPQTDKTNISFLPPSQFGPPTSSVNQTNYLAPSQFGAPPPVQTNFNSQYQTTTTSQTNYQSPSQAQYGAPPTGPGQNKPTATKADLITQNRPVVNTTQQLTNQFNNMSIQPGSNNRSQPNALDLLREKKIILPYNEDVNDPPRPVFPHEFYTTVNCHADTIRCTLTSIPESQNLLNKARLPLGILIHPFKDLESLKVVQSSTIVRCRNCRSYINPFVHFLDNSKWRCNLCYSINDLPEEFLFDPVTRTYGDPLKRPEINSATIEFIAPPEYTLRPPPPAMYLYLLDVSHNAINTGYLHTFCETLAENLDKIPGDSRAQIGFITYSSSIHFYNLSDSLSQPKMMICPDLDDIVLPMPDSLMVNLNENKESIQMFLQSLPNLFADTYETDSALGTALNAAFQLLKQTGGRISIMQTCLPNVGIGGLKQREDIIDKDSSNLAPQTDFYKKLALDCAGVQIAVDLFMLNSLNADLATLSCVSKYSGGEIKYYPGFHPDTHPEQVIRYCADLKRYLTRKIGFEAVMRIRCTRGLAIHTFHGNFFVRSTDLLALPNVNPDAGFGMQVNIEETLTDIPSVCFQAAVLYTSSKSERRIRIHTYCLPVSKNLNEIVNGADQEAIIGLIAKMAVDRTAMSSLKEARDAMINVAIDYLQAYSQQITSHNKNSSLMSPYYLRLIPLLVLGLMKNTAFKFGSIKMDDRVYAMNLCKTMPLKYLILSIYPHLYAIHNLDDKKVITDSYDTEIYIPPKMHLSSENIDRHGVYIMDCGESIYMWIGRSVSDLYLQLVFDCKSFNELPDHITDLPELENELSEKIRNFLAYLYDSRPFGITFLCFKEGSHYSSLFFKQMHDDKSESSISYYEFLKHLSDQVNS